MNLIEKPLPPSCYFQEETKKIQIVLHTTGAGFPVCTTNLYRNYANKTSCPYIVDSEGIIWELYDETEGWSYHLSPLIFGRNGGWQPGEQDRKTIGIDLVNYGPLHYCRAAYDDNLMVHPVEKDNPFCHISQTDLYVKTPFRGKRFFQKFAPAQVLALVELIDLLCDRHEIARNILDENMIERHCPQDIKHFSGIATHANYRNDVHDIGAVQGEPIWQALRQKGFD